MARKRKASRRIVVFFADLHSGHLLGLLSPDAHWEMEGADGKTTDYYPRLTETQKYLWPEAYTWAMKKCFDYAQGDEIILIHGGDLTQGNKYGSLVSPLQDHQAAMGYYNLLPWFEYKNLSTLYLVFGTGAHNYGGGGSERSVAQLLRLRFPKRRIQVLGHGRIGVKSGERNVTFDTAHHGPYPGSRRHLRGNIARFYLRDAMMTDLSIGITPADVYLRAHYHMYFPPESLTEEWQDKTYFSRLVEVPSFCGLGEHARKTTRSQPTQTHGLVLFEIVGGVITEVVPFKKTIDLRTEVTI